MLQRIVRALVVIAEAAGRLKPFARNFLAVEIGDKAILEVNRQFQRVPAERVIGCHSEHSARVERVGLAGDAHDDLGPQPG